MKNRDPIFDVVKAFLMYFVICGHLQAANIIAAPSVPLPTWYSALVIGASMPCFFAISGLFAVKTLEAKEWARIIARISTFLWPILSLGIIFGVYSAFRMKDWTSVLLAPIWLWRDLWFIRTLATIYLVSAIIFALSDNTAKRLTMFAVVYAGLVFLPGNMPCYGHFKWVMHMLPYFVFGIFALRRLMARDAYKIAIGCGLFFLIVAVCEGNVRENGMAFYWVNTHWRAMICTRNGLLCFFGRTAMGIAGTVALLWFFRRLLAKMPLLTKLAPLGTTTLGVYAMHQWLLARVGSLGRFPLPSQYHWLVGLSVFLACHMLVIGVRTMPMVNCCLFGNEQWLRKRLPGFRVHNKRLDSK